MTYRKREVWRILRSDPFAAAGELPIEEDYPAPEGGYVPPREPHVPGARYPRFAGPAERPHFAV